MTPVRLSQPAIDRCLEQGVQQAVERVLAAPTVEGLPYAQPLGGDEDAAWKPLADFTADEAEDLIARRTATLEQAQEALRRLQQWQRDRFSDEGAAV